MLCALCFVLSVRLFSKLCALLRHFFSLPIEKKRKKKGFVCSWIADFAVYFNTADTCLFGYCSNF